jgi:hypothetical protein
MKRSLLSVLAALPVLAGDFINLTFDEPDVSGALTEIYPGGPKRGSAAALLRGWNVSVAGQPYEFATISSFPVGSGNDPVSLLGNPPAEPSSLLGGYTLGIHSPVPPAPEIRLSQRGTIPADAAGLWLASGYVQVFADGLKIGEVNPMVGGRSIIDVSPYAGKEVALEFLVESGWSIRFDILGFVPVPEPSTWALLGVGAAALFCIGRRKN